MRKTDEMSDSNSCFNMASDNERLFILLARDPAAPVAIRAWIAERVRLGKNTAGDAQIREAIECAARMDVERAEIEVTRRQQKICWDGMAASGRFVISKLATVHDVTPARVELTWPEVVARFSAAVRTECTIGSCPGVRCSHKLGVCWSPAEITGDRRRRDMIGALSLLVFDVDRATTSQLEEIRGRLVGYQHMIHATHADRLVPESSRHVRIIVALERPLLRDAWPEFWRSAQRRLAPGADPAGADPGRIYFLPSRPADADYFVEIGEGAPLDVDMMTAWRLLDAAMVSRGDTAAPSGEVAP